MRGKEVSFVSGILLARMQAHHYRIVRIHGTQRLVTKKQDQFVYFLDLLGSKQKTI